MNELFKTFNKLFDEAFNSDEMKNFFNEQNNNNSYYKKEKWVNGELVSRDEVEYKDGKQVKDEHFDSNKSIENETSISVDNKDNNISNCKCSEKDKDAELRKSIKEDEKIYNELQFRYDALKIEYVELLSRYNRMKSMMDKMKKFFLNE